ncbi:unnamed protein product [Cylindrotheca closterium]|uniref:Transmembrane protein n=1 Tax=Cylindrotheca closterium TaxID=2856 RepID=A0AAD2FBN0_9STRA|nr:unnamed protein product [Cylindrotheca closterium]
MLQRSLIVFALCLSYSTPSVLAFSPGARNTKKTTFSGKTILQSSEDSPEEPEVPQQIPQQPPAPRQKRMDPLLASLTKQDPSIANAPTTTVPLFGEIPADSVKVLVPIAVVGIMGFLYSIVVTVSSGDELTAILMQAGNAISEKAATQPNQVYDPDVCRGICTPDQSGLKVFMESLRK